MITMIDTGYMAKKVRAKPDSLHVNNLVDIYSVAGCISDDFTDYIRFWCHNGYWLFDSPEKIVELAKLHAIDLRDTKLFYYQVDGLQWHEGERQWQPFAPEPSFPVAVTPPTKRRLEGFDVVTFSCGNSAECSPLSCNGLASELGVNVHCLIGSLEDAKSYLENGKFDNSEPGPFRIFAVYSVEWPSTVAKPNS